MPSKTKDKAEGKENDKRITENISLLSLRKIACFFIFGKGADAGKLVAKRIYFDNELLLRQLRGETPKTIGLAQTDFASAVN